MVCFTSAQRPYHIQRIGMTASSSSQEEELTSEMQSSSRDEESEPNSTPVTPADNSDDDSDETEGVPFQAQSVRPEAAFPESKVLQEQERESHSSPGHVGEEVNEPGGAVPSKKHSSSTETPPSSTSSSSASPTSSSTASSDSQETETPQGTFQAVGNLEDKPSDTMAEKRTEDSSSSEPSSTVLDNSENHSSSASDHGNDQESINLSTPYQNMLQMTLELVQDVLLIRPGDPILTQFGRGICLEKYPHENKMKIDLSFGTLYTYDLECLHKILNDDQYDQAMESLDQVRRLDVLKNCELFGVEYLEDACVPCMFQRPTVVRSNHQDEINDDNGEDGKEQKPKSRWGRFASRAAVKTNASNDGAKRKRICRKCSMNCDVCGNPVCKYHILDQDYFILCCDCSHDLQHVESTLTMNHPDVEKNLFRLLTFYTRLSVQLCREMPTIDKLSEQIDETERRHGAISIGNSTIGFVGASLSLAGTAAALFTPAGPAILLAGVATSASSASLQITHSGWRKVSKMEAQANRRADCILGWHGLCIGILACLEQLRQELLTKHRLLLQQSQQQRVHLRKTNKHNSSLAATSSTSLWKNVAQGGFATTRHTVTGMGAYSQVMQTSLQVTPVVGGILAMGFMAMDAANISSTLRNLQQPHQKCLALKAVQESYPVNIQENISGDVKTLLKAIDDLRRDEALIRNEEDAILEEMAQKAAESELQKIEEELQNIK